MVWSRKELEDVQTVLARGFKPGELAEFKRYCHEYVWHRLCNLASMYEELVREWFLPSVLAQLASYPEPGRIVNSDQVAPDA